MTLLPLLSVFAATALAGLSTVDVPEFRLAVPAEPLSLDWNQASGSSGELVLENIMEGLARVGDDLQLRPGLASWSASADGKTYVFTLKEEARWSDGSRVTPTDILTSWRRVLANPERFPQASLLFGVVGARDFSEGRLKDFSLVGLSAQGSTIKVQLTTVDPAFPLYTAQAALFPVPTKLIESKPEHAFEVGTLITAGPYVPRSWSKGKEIVLERNPRYYGRPPKAQRVRLILEANPDKQRQMFMLGQTDALLGATPADELVLKLADKAFSPLQFRTLTTVVLGFNTRSPWTKELTLRRAVAHALDRTRLASRADRGWVPLSSLIPAGMVGFDGSFTPPFSPDQARALYSLLPPSNRPGQITILCEDQTPYREIASDVALFLERLLGVKGRINAVASEDFPSEARAQNFDLVLGSRRAEDPQPLPFLEAFRTGHPANWFGFSSLEVDRLLTAARLATAPAQALETLRVVHKIIARDQVVAAPLFQRTETILISPAVRGLMMSPLHRVYFSTVEM